MAVFYDTGGGDMVNEYDRDLRQFVLGEIRVDGWKSEWRKEFERYLAAQAAAAVREKEEQIRDEH